MDLSPILIGVVAAAAFIAVTRGIGYLLDRLRIIRVPGKRTLVMQSSPALFVAGVAMTVFWAGVTVIVWDDAYWQTGEWLYFVLLIAMVCSVFFALCVRGASFSLFDWSSQQLTTFTGFRLRTMELPQELCFKIESLGNRGVKLWLPLSNRKRILVLWASNEQVFDRHLKKYQACLPGDTVVARFETIE